MTEADIGMTEHRSKNTLGRSVPVKTNTDVEEDGTSEDGSPRPVCITLKYKRFKKSPCVFRVISFETLEMTFRASEKNDTLFYFVQY